MEITLKANSRAKGQNTHVTLLRGLVWGLIGGLASTMVMDLVLMGVLTIAGLPAFTCFSIIGDTVARAFSFLGIQMAGSVLIGVAAHYLIGPAVGIIFGGVVTRVSVLRLNTMKKGIVLAVLYVEILSQPILATTPIFLKMTVTETLLWFGASFVMHLILAVVLGAIVSYGLRTTDPIKHK